MLNCAKLAAVRTETVRESIRQAMDRAVESAPSLVVIDDLDLLCPNSEDTSQAQLAPLRSRQLSECLVAMICDRSLAATRALQRPRPRVAVIASCQSKDLLQTMLQASPATYLCLSIPPPSLHGRQQVRHSTEEFDLYHL